MVTCGLCGRSYEPGGASCRTNQCPLAFRGCQIAHCPHCGYTTADDTRGLAGWLGRLLSGTLATEREVAPLTDLRAGACGVLERIDAEPGVAAALTLLGLTPGRRLSLQQRFPAFVVGLDGTEVALERAVAEHVWVRRAPGATRGGDL
jgi:Fe2+ transport system protein FeoA